MDDRLHLLRAQRASAGEVEHDRRGRLAARANEGGRFGQREMHARAGDRVHRLDGAGEVGFARGADAFALYRAAGADRHGFHEVDAVVAAARQSTRRGGHARGVIIALAHGDRAGASIDAMVDARGGQRLDERGLVFVGHPGEQRALRRGGEHQPQERDDARDRNQRYQWQGAGQGGLRGERAQEGAQAFWDGDRGARRHRDEFRAAHQTGMLTMSR